MGLPLFPVKGFWGTRKVHTSFLSMLLVVLSTVLCIHECAIRYGFSRSWLDWITIPSPCLGISVVICCKIEFNVSLSLADQEDLVPEDLRTLDIK